MPNNKRPQKKGSAATAARDAQHKRMVSERVREEEKRRSKEASARDARKSGHDENIPNRVLTNMFQDGCYQSAEASNRKTCDGRSSTANSIQHKIKS